MGLGGAIIVGVALFGAILFLWSFTIFFNYFFFFS